MHENGPPENCPPGVCSRCDGRNGDHKLWCKRHPSNLTHEAVAERALVTERGVQQTSAERYRDLEVGSGDVCGPAAPPQPGIEEYSQANLEGRGGARYLNEADRIEGEARRDAYEARTTLPTNPLARKHIPLASGCLDYFPAALAAVAVLSQIGNEQHNPGKPMYWNRAKSGDEADALLRHLAERGTIDTDGQRHSVKVAWRALALLQKELEAEAGAPMAPGARPE